MKMLAYRERPAEEWTPLFWSILRSRIVDIQRRADFRLRWLLPQREQRGPRPTGPTTAPDRLARHDQREGYAQMLDALRALPAANARPSRLRVPGGTGRRQHRAGHGLQRRLGQDTSFARAQRAASKSGGLAMNANVTRTTQPSTAPRSTTPCDRAPAARRGRGQRVCRHAGAAAPAPPTRARQTGATGLRHASRHGTTAGWGGAFAVSHSRCIATGDATATRLHAARLADTAATTPRRRQASRQ